MSRNDDGIDGVYYQVIPLLRETLEELTGELNELRDDNQRMHALLTPEQLAILESGDS